MMRKNLPLVLGLSMLLAFVFGCSSDNSGRQRCGEAGCETDSSSGTGEDDTGTGSDTGSDDDTDSASQTSDTESQPEETLTPSDTEDTGTGTGTGTDTGTGPAETATEETDTGNDPTGPHGTTRGILFTAKQSSHPAEKARLYFVNWDGTGLVDLSGEVSLDIYTPCWPEDGDDIYFVQGYDVRTVPWPVPETFAPVPLAVTGWSIDVSCQGDRLTYTSQPSDGDSVHVYTRSMGEDDERQITDYTGTLVINKPMMPALAPSLDAVAFGLLNGDDVYDIYSSDLYLAHLGPSITIENLTQEGAVTQAKVVNRSPHWAPDGELIAYMHVLDGVAEVRTIDPAAKATSKTTVTEINTGFGGADVLAWAPDSQVLAVIDGDDYGTIRIVTLDGTEEGRINTGLYEIDSISWR